MICQISQAPMSQEGGNPNPNQSKNPLPKKKKKKKPLPIPKIAQKIKMLFYLFVSGYEVLKTLLDSTQVVQTRTARLVGGG